MNIESLDTLAEVKRCCILVESNYNNVIRFRKVYSELANICNILTTDRGDFKIYHNDIDHVLVIDRGVRKLYRLISHNITNQKLKL